MRSKKTLIIILFIIIAAVLCAGLVFLRIGKNRNEGDAESGTVTKEALSAARSLELESMRISAENAETEAEEEAIPPAEEAVLTPNKGIKIAIDPGHQKTGNSEPEPIGPGASQTKAKVAGGTSGVVTGIPENELNLTVSLKLRDELEERGYEVIMIREEADVNISNAERAEIANGSGASIFLRIHANGGGSSQNGTLTMCMTKNNPFNAELYEDSRRLSDIMVNAITAQTGSANLGVQEVDNMSGINWCKIPVTIIEMGFMTNPEEDQKMATDEYQELLVKGMANGVDEYFEGAAE